MPMTHYFAETSETKTIAAIWVKPKGKSVPRVFDPSRDTFDSNSPALFSGASEEEIKRWIKARSKRKNGRA